MNVSFKNMMDSSALLSLPVYKKIKNERYPSFFEYQSSREFVILKKTATRCRYPKFTDLSELRRVALRLRSDRFLQLFYLLGFISFSVQQKRKYVKQKM